MRESPKRLKTERKISSEELDTLIKSQVDPKDPDGFGPRRLELSKLLKERGYSLDLSHIPLIDLPCDALEGKSKIKEYYTYFKYLDFSGLTFRSRLYLRRFEGEMNLEDADFSNAVIDGYIFAENIKINDKTNISGAVIRANKDVGYGSYCVVIPHPFSQTRVLRNIDDDFVKRAKDGVCAAVSNLIAEPSSSFLEFFSRDSESWYDPDTEILEKMQIATLVQRYFYPFTTKLTIAFIDTLKEEIEKILKSKGEVILEFLPPKVKGEELMAGHMVYLKGIKEEGGKVRLCDPNWGLSEPHDITRVIEALNRHYKEDYCSDSLIFRVFPPQYKETLYNLAKAVWEKPEVLKILESSTSGMVNEKFRVTINNMIIGYSVFNISHNIKTHIMKLMKIYYGQCELGKDEKKLYKFKKYELSITDPKKDKKNYLNFIRVVEEKFPTIRVYYLLKAFAQYGSTNPYSASVLFNNSETSEATPKEIIKCALFLEKVATKIDDLSLVCWKLLSHSYKDFEVKYKAKYSFKEVLEKKPKEQGMIEYLKNRHLPHIITIKCKEDSVEI